MGYADNVGATASADAMLRLQRLNSALKKESRERETRLVPSRPLHLSAGAGIVGRAVPPLSPRERDDQAAFVATRVAACRVDTVPEVSVSRLSLSLRNTLDSRESWRRNELDVPGVGEEREWMRHAVQADRNTGMSSSPQRLIPAHLIPPIDPMCLRSRRSSAACPW